MKITVVGLGAVGGFIAARLALAQAAGSAHTVSRWPAAQRCRRCASAG